MHSKTCVIVYRNRRCQTQLSYRIMRVSASPMSCAKLWSQKHDTWPASLLKLQSQAIKWHLYCDTQIHAHSSRTRQSSRRLCV